MPKLKEQMKTPDRARALITEQARQYGYDVDKLAGAIGVSRSTMYKMIREGTKNWTVEQIFKMARFLDIPYADMRAVLP